MIRKDRKIVAVPDILSSKTGAGAIERRRVIDFYKIKNNANRKFNKYTVYSHDTVKDALNKLFSNKCAYCEMDYGGAPLDIEHFRPKGAIAEWCKISRKVIRVKPGYYWLAADWENLLPSCIDCNRRRTHTFSGQARVTGKAEFFPIAVTSKRARKPKGELAELAMLIDPSAEDPSRMLVFSRDGTVSAKFKQGMKHERAIQTIECFGLQRDPLVRKRERHARIVLDCIDRINAGAIALKNHSGTSRWGEDFARFEKDSDFLESMTNDDQPFLALTFQLIEQYLIKGP